MSSFNLKYANIYDYRELKLKDIMKKSFLIIWISELCITSIFFLLCSSIALLAAEGKAGASCWKFIRIWHDTMQVTISWMFEFNLMFCKRNDFKIQEKYFTQNIRININTIWFLKRESEISYLHKVHFRRIQCILRMLM